MPELPSELRPRPARPWHVRVRNVAGAAERWVIDWFRQYEPSFRNALVPLLMLSVLLFIRHPATNYIFDEQEALLANPYVNGTDGMTFGDAIYVDFWGLPATASIGSYRPIPNFIWRATWWISKHPFFHHLYNLLFHAINGALLASFTYAVTRRRLVGWLSGTAFIACAVITEAVSGIVGIADVLGGLGAMLALCSLRLPGAWMPLGVFSGVCFGLFCKESAMTCVPLVPVAALLFAPQLHPRRPARFGRALLALLAGAAAFVLYVELRKNWFPSSLPEALREALPEGASRAKQLYRDLLIWFHQAPLPQDPLNNPLSEADTAHRIAGALRVYWRGLTQVLVPLRLSGDYSFPQEPVPASLYEWETIAGGIAMALPLCVAPCLMIYGWFVERRDKRQLVPDSSDMMIAFRALGEERNPYRHQLEAVLVERPRGPWGRRKLEIAAILISAGAAGLGVEAWMFLGGSPHWVRTWPVSVMVLLSGFGLLIDGWRDQKHPMEPSQSWPWRHIAPALAALALTWIVVSYFPHSNIPVVLPTVRAERFWYFPVIGSAMGMALLFSWIEGRWHDVQPLKRFTGGMSVGALLAGAFLTFQAMQAYRHSMDYKNDLAFWHATKIAVPKSAKAHLNYSVMVGARSDLETRLVESRIALELAPQWPMAHVYTGDTLCRMHRGDEAWPYYEKGFSLGPNERSLLSLGLQCMYDEGLLVQYDKQLRALSEEHAGSWLAYLAVDTLDNHEEHKGVDPEYRPRGYNQGPKKE